MFEHREELRYDLRINSRTKPQPETIAKVDLDPATLRRTSSPAIDDIDSNET